MEATVSRRDVWSAAIACNRPEHGRTGSRLDAPPSSPRPLHRTKATTANRRRTSIDQALVVNRTTGGHGRPDELVFRVPAGQLRLPIRAEERAGKEWPKENLESDCLLWTSEGMKVMKGQEVGELQFGRLRQGRPQAGARSGLCFSKYLRRNSKAIRKRINGAYDQCCFVKK